MEESLTKLFRVTKYTKADAFLSKKEALCKYSRNTGKNGDGIPVLAKLQCISHGDKEDMNM